MYKCQISFNIQKKYRSELLKYLYFLDEKIENIQFDDDKKNFITYDYRDANLPETLDERLREVTENLIKTLEQLNIKVIYSNNIRVRGCPNHYDELLREKWIIPTGKGNYLYAGLMNKLFNILDWQFQRIAKQLQVSAYKFPNMLNLDHIKRTGYLENFPHNANFVSHLPEQIESINLFKSTVENIDKNLSETQKSLLVSPDYLLSPTVCYHFYSSLFDSILEENLVAATAMSSCYRYESKACRGLYRLREFNMREIIFVGKEDIITEQREVLLNCAKHVLELCGLKSVIQTASDPFFLGDNIDKRRYLQTSFDLKHEMLAYLPDEDDWLAIGSINYHQNHFGRAFNIRLASGEPAYSCCLGFGIDRWCAAISAQYGLNESLWPDSLQTLINLYDKI
jgi:seryl-tRNA synthetase